MPPSLPATTAPWAILWLFTAFFLIFAAVTAFGFSCLVPTLFLASAGGDGRAAERNEQRQAGDHVRVGQLATESSAELHGSPLGCRIPIRAHGSKPLSHSAYFFPNMEQAELIWHNGEFVPWEEAKVHVLSHGLHYGTGVFEGIRCYETERGPAIFRHPDHLDRLAKSAELYYLDLPYTTEEMRSATHELIARNGLQSCYIRPLAFRGYGEMGLYAQSAPIEVIIAVWPWGAYLGDEGKQQGIRAKVSSWRTISGDSLIPHAKASGQYLNSILAKTESANAGYDEAILLDEHGFVSEGSGENVFVIRDGVLCTPPHIGGDPRRDHPQLGGPDRPRPRLHGRGAQHRPGRALPRR